MTELQTSKNAAPAASDPWGAAGRILPGLAAGLRGGWAQILGVRRRRAQGPTAGGGPSRPPSMQGGGLFRKYAALLVALIGGALIVNAAIEMYYSYGESRDALIAVQREKAQGAAAVIQQFVKEIEGQVGWATGRQPLGSGLEQRRLDFLRLLLRAPPI